MTEYDYQQDAPGTGEDCHVATRSSIASRGDDLYDIGNSSSLPGSLSPDDVQITLEGGEIVFRYLGEVFDPEFGEGQSGITERFPAVTTTTADALVLCGG